MKNNSPPQSKVVTDISWILRMTSEIGLLTDTNTLNIVFNFSDLDWINLYEWTSFVSFCDKFVKSHQVIEINFNFFSDEKGFELLKGKKYIQKKTVINNDETLGYSKKLYKLLGFLESISNMAVLMSSDRCRFNYSNVNINDIALEKFYKPDDKITILHGLTVIDSKSDCKRFLEDEQILNWRNVMGSRFRLSPLIENEELWRIICHELAANVWEHSGVTGFISARVVEPNEDGSIKQWCRDAFSESLHDMISNFKSPFLEVCIADAGRGVISTLEESYRRVQSISPDVAVSPDEVAAFAFDEFGTSKDEDESWITDRHALGRILSVTAKYGGSLILRTSNLELSYISKNGVMEKGDNGISYGYSHKYLNSELPGTHIQIILPLYPAKDRRSTNKRSVLFTHLPSTFYPNDVHAKGHLVPVANKLKILEPGVGRLDQKEFQVVVKRLCASLLKRPRNETFVFDMSDLRWEAPQFETFFFLLHNVITTRPVLLVELDPGLATRVTQLEDLQADTFLTKTIERNLIDKSAKIVGSISEHRYLETYSRIHKPILAIDKDGNKYLFGVADYKYRKILLSLIDKPKSIKQLLTQNKALNEQVIASFLNPESKLFEINAGGQWTCAWSKKSLAIEARRVMSRHFDNVVERCGALRGVRSKISGDKGVEIFNLPWEDEWLKEFIQASRILCRERTADEAAQRLIYRLIMWLGDNAYTISDVKALACVTAPSLMLATAIHRWWPASDPPAVIDLGFHLLLGHAKQSPCIKNQQGIVIIQDILDTSRVTSDLINFFHSEGAQVLCTLALIKVINNLTATRVTSAIKDWSIITGKNWAVPAHAMVEMRRPKEAEPPKENEDDSNAYWVEPRSLRPMKFSSLRREFDKGQDPILERRHKCLELFDSSDDDCLFTYGHYVYGKRHYSIAIDTKAALTGRIGNKVSSWVADICEGGKHKKHISAPWEKPEGKDFRGDVWAILMPIQSQIHYLWPKIASELARRGRRVPLYLLDATIFSGKGTTYRLPPQLRYEISRIVSSQVSSDSGAYPPLRLFILDDAIATGRTIETIMGALLLAISDEYKIHEKNPSDFESPIEWVRYFVLLNQMGHAHHLLWHNLQALSNIKIIFEEFAPFMGVPVYEETDCPTCSDLRRLERLRIIAEKHAANEASVWINQRIHNLRPVIMGTSDATIIKSPMLSKRIIPLVERLSNKQKPHRHPPQHADTSIWSFYELMYMSYPPSDVLRQLHHAWPDDADKNNAQEYERYRMAVYEWCIRNWSRLVANTARREFAKNLIKEIDGYSDIALQVLEMTSIYYMDEYVSKIIKHCIDILASLEGERARLESGVRTDRVKKTIFIDTGLTLFFLNIPKNELGSDPNGKAFHENIDALIEHIDTQAKPLDRFGPSFLRNLYRRLIRPQRHASPSWALWTIAESLFRGRDEVNDPSGHHKLLPKLVDNILYSKCEKEDYRLLQGSLSLFIAGLEDLTPYAVFLHGEIIKAFSRKVLLWLKTITENDTIIDPPPELSKLSDMLDLKGSFCQEFNKIFQENVNNIMILIKEYSHSNSNGYVNFIFDCPSALLECRVLAHVDRLLVCLNNIMIDPFKKYPGKMFTSKIKVKMVKYDSNIDQICFRALTSFDTLENTIHRTSSSLSSNSERNLLKAFDCRFSDWSEPDETEKYEGFQVALEIFLPVGF